MRNAVFTRHVRLAFAAAVADTLVYTVGRKLLSDESGADFVAFAAGYTLRGIDSTDRAVGGAFAAHRAVFKRALVFTLGNGQLAVGDDAAEAPRHTFFGDEAF